MVLLGEMEAYGICSFAMPDIVEVRIESLCQDVFSLVNILFLAGKARNEVDQI